MSFRVSAEPAPAAPLTVNVSWSESGTFLAGKPAGETVTIPTSGSVELEADTNDDSGDEADGSVTVTVLAGSGYAVGSPASATRDGDRRRHAGGDDHCDRLHGERGQCGCRSR